MWSALVPGHIRMGELHAHVPGRSTTLPGAVHQAIPFGEWFTFEVIAEGNRLVTKVNGKISTDARDATTLEAGHVALGRTRLSLLEFRRIEIKELADVVVALSASARSTRPGRFRATF